MSGKRKTTRKTRAELYDEASYLRSQGLSFSQIGEKLAFTKQYIHKLLKKGPPEVDESSTESTETSPDRRRGLTVRERKFAAGLLQGKKQKDAVLDAIEPGELTEQAAEKWASRTVREGHFQSEFKKLLDRAGLSEEKLAEVHTENLGATKVVATATKDGEITDVLERPDYQTRQRAVEEGWRIHGRSRPDAAEDTKPPTEISMSVQFMKQAEAVIGQPLAPPERIFWKHEKDKIDPSMEGTVIVIHDDERPPDDKPPVINVTRPAEGEERATVATAGSESTEKQHVGDGESQPA